MAKPAKPEDFMDGAPPFAFEAETLSGDIRDALLSHVRSMRVPWAMLNEEEQRYKIDAISSAAADLVRQTVALLSSRHFPAVVVTTGAWKVDKGIEIKLGAASSTDNIAKLAEHGNGAALLILAEASDYFGERQPAKPDKNQRRLPLDDGKD